MQERNKHHKSIAGSVFASLICMFHFSFMMPIVFADSSQLVPPERQISDFEAKLMLARVLSYSDSTLEESLKQYESLRITKPGTFEIEKEIAMIYSRLGKQKKVEGIIRPLFKNHPDDPFLLEAMANIEASLGHATKCRELYQRALEKSTDREKTLLAFASTMQMWGDFYQAEKIFRDYLIKNPDDRNVFMSLCTLLSGTLRHEEANALCKNFILQKGINSESTDCLKQSTKPKSDDIAVQFHANFINKTNYVVTAQKMIESGKWDAMGLTRWAELCTKKGFLEPAELLFRKASQLDPECFPALIGLAQVLASSNKYKDSIDNYKKLDREFPNTWKITIEKARVLGWSKQYKESLEEYRKLRALNPFDYVPLREMARVAAWGNMMDLSVSFYKELMTPAVDNKLSAVLSPLSNKQGNSKLEEAVRLLNQRNPEKPGYLGFEQISTNLDIYSAGLAPEDKKTLNSSIILLGADYAIQKKAWLEMQSKVLRKEKRYTRAISACKELLDFEPDNQETMFDYAQLLHLTGLSDKSSDVYNELLRISPLHNLAPIALKQEEMLKHPAIKANEFYWKENGHGDLSHITRNRNDFGMELPFSARTHLEISRNLWQEKIPGEGQTHKADGMTISGDTTFNEYLKASASFTTKRYESHDFKDLDSGYANLRANLHDYAILDLGFERSDEIYNHFGMIQGIQADQWKVSVLSDITPFLEIKGMAKYLDYNDGNEGVDLLASAGYAFTDFPHIFKIILSEEYRNMKEKDLSLYSTSFTDLINIIHPYWCPSDYTAHSITFEWFHDISKLQISGAQRHYYDIKVSFGTDSENDPSARLEAEWRYEFLKHLSAGFRGMVHRSKEWDADSIFGEISYRF